MKRGVLLLMTLLLTGCASVAREPDDLTLIRVLGVDGENPVLLTAVSGVEGGEAPVRGNGSGSDFSRAREAVLWSGSGTELSLTGVSYLVVGEDADLEQVLLAVLEDADLGASAAVFWTADEAAELLNDSDDPASDLNRLMLKDVGAPTVAQALAALATEGKVALPCLEEEDGRIEEWGTMIWDGGN